MSDQGSNKIGTLTILKKLCSVQDYDYYSLSLLDDGLSNGYASAELEFPEGDLEDVQNYKGIGMSIEMVSRMRNHNNPDLKPEAKAKSLYAELESLNISLAENIVPESDPPMSMTGTQKLTLPLQENGKLPVLADGSQFQVCTVLNLLNMIFSH